MSPQNFEFHLPLSPEELLKSGGVNQYVVQEVLPIKHLPSQLRAFQSAFRARGPLAMLEHFDTVYSILHHFRSVDPGLKEDTLEFLIKGVDGFGGWDWKVLCLAFPTFFSHVMISRLL